MTITLSRQGRRLLAASVLTALLWLSVSFAFLLDVRRADPLALCDVAGAPAIRPDMAAALGVNLEASELSSPALEQTLLRLERAGIRWVRFTLPWDRLEPARGQFDWTPWDRVFAAIAMRQAMRSLVVLNGSPEWARPPADAGNPLAPPHERADFGAYAAAVARRYADQVRYYQVWHEPNIAPHWGGRPVDPIGYAGLLREAALQIRAADSDAVIVLAALAPTTEAGGANLSDITFLDELYRAGARTWFDIVAAQPYGFSAAFDAAPDPAALNFSRAALLRQVMLRHGDAAAPIWAAAFGWNALPPGWTGRPSSWGQVTADEQARNAAGVVDLAATRWPWLGLLVWAANCPPRPADDPWRGFALCDADDGMNPTAQALAAAGPRPDLLPPGDHAMDHPALHYGPGWRVTSAAADPAADGDALDFSFYGSDLALRMQGGPYWAYLRVSVDGQPANSLPRDESGAAYLALHDPLAEERVVSVARGLTRDVHQARLEAVGGWGQWALRGVLVSASPASAPSRLPWILATLAGLASVIWLALAWPWRSAAARRLQAMLALGQSPGLARAAGLPDAVGWAAALILVLALILSRWLVVDLVALACLGLLFLARPDLSLPLIAASIPFWPAPKTLLRWQFSHFEIFVTLAAAAMALRWALRHGGQAEPEASAQPPAGVIAIIRDALRRLQLAVRGPLCPARLDLAVAALALSGLISAVAAERHGVSLREFRIVFLDAALFYWLIAIAPWPRGREFSPWPLVNGLMAGMAIVSMLALWQLATGQGRVDVEGVWRVRGLYGSPNNLALALDRAAPLALALAVFGSQARFHTRLARNRWLSAAPRAGYGLALLIIAAACIGTFSKGALLLGLPAGMGLVLLLAAWRTRRRSALLFVAAATVVGAVGLALLFRTPRFADLLNFESGTTFFRLKLWQGAWQMALDHPLLGVGPDNFLYAYRTRYVLPGAWQELNLSHPHNILLDLWTRLGLIGVAAGGWTIWTAFRSGWRVFRTAPGEVWPLALGLLGGLAAMVAHGLIDNSIFLVDLMALFMLAMALFRRNLGESRA